MKGQTKNKKELLSTRNLFFALANILLILLTIFETFYVKKREARDGHEKFSRMNPITLKVKRLQMRIAKAV
jgi:hypothetical protein